MLCSSKNNRRPDKQLQSRLISLAYALVLLTINVILFLLWPEYRIYLIFAMLLISSMCIYLTLKTISDGEAAMTYGGFANEIIKNEFKAKRIENSLLETVIENERAKDLFKQDCVFKFLERNLADGKSNKAALYSLKAACENLTRETVSLALRFHTDTPHLFNEEEWFEVSVSPIFLKKADIFEGPYSIKAIKKDTYLFWNCKNITAEKNMEQIFHEERKSLHDFLDYLPVGLYVIDREHKIEYVNHAFAQTLERSREELLGRPLGEFMSPVSKLPEPSASWNGKIYFTTPENEVLDCHVFHENFRENQQIKTRGVIISGLPDNRQLRNELNAAFDKISWLFNYAPVGIIFADKQGIIRTCNQTAAGFLHGEPETLGGHSLFEHMTADDSAKVQKDFGEVSAGTVASASIDAHLKFDKEEKIASFYISPMQKFYSAGNSGDGLVVYLIDATKQKSLEQQFAQAQKMQAIGQLAGGVAHDFNNLLTAMIGFCDLLLQRHGVGDPSFSDLTQIKQNANRAAGLVRQLLAFSRKQPLKPKLIDITEKFTELSLMLKRILGEQIILKFYHSNELGFVRVDPTQFSQVILNLAINAKDAMDGHGTININTHVETLAEPYQFGADTIKPGEFVVIDVIDTGCGIPPENLNRIFDPFFSTKQNVVGSGTGLGLAMVYGIVRQTEGFIKVDSIVGRGTTFSVYLPRFESNAEADEPDSATDKHEAKSPDGTPVLTVKETVKSPITTANGKMIFGLNVSMIDRSFDNRKDETASAIRILFVEDEDSVRTFAVRALKKKGYDIISCNSSENALEQLEKDCRFDLLLTDMMLPGMSGTELAAIVKEKIPGIKIILASGYSEEIARQGLSNSDDFDFIAKPFSLGDLTKKVFDVLNQPGK